MQPALISAAIFVGLLAVLVAVRTIMVARKYEQPIRRIFEESPIFVPTEGVPSADALDIEFVTPEGVILRGSYLSTPSPPARGLVVFCHEFRSGRWSGDAYWVSLRQSGFDIFTFDFRGHGQSDKDPAYEPRHWVTNYELDDLEAALTCIKKLPQAAGLPIGLFGISRGGGAAIAAAARDSSIRCVVTDGAFPTHGTMLTYMRKWISLVVGERLWIRFVPNWYLMLVRDSVLARVERDFGCRFIRLERYLRSLSPRPILMVHGGRDSYIRPDIAREFFARAREPRELWIVDGARHNACLDKARAEYLERVVGFFGKHLVRAN